MMNRYLPHILLLIAILQPLAGTLAPVFGIGTPIGNATRDFGAPEQPIPAVFSIWSLIFLSFLGFALGTFRTRAPWMLALASPLALAGGLNIIWMLSAQLFAYQPLDFLLLFPIATASWIAARRFDNMRDTGGSGFKLLADMTTGLLAGWISVAIAISIPLTIRSFTSLGPTDLPWNMLWATLVTAGCAAWVFTHHVSRSLWFFVALGWGLLGITLNNWYITGMHWLAIVTGLILVIMLGLRLMRGAKGALQAGA